jgi:hypothetical protein
MNKRFNDTEFQTIHPDSRHHIHVVPVVVAREELELVKAQNAALIAALEQIAAVPSHKDAASEMGSIARATLAAVQS